MLRERDSAIAAEQQTGANNQGGAPMGRRTFWRALQARDGIHDKSGEEEAGARHEKRRDGFDCESDPEIGRAPNQIKRRESGKNGELTGSWDGTHGGTGGNGL